MVSFEIKDYISSVAIIISVCIAVFGWVYNSKINRKHEIFKRAIDARIKLLEKYLLFSESAVQLGTFNGFNEIQVQIYIYGEEDEIALIKDIAQNIVTMKTMNPQIYSKFIELNKLIRDKLRNELGLSAINI